MLRKGRAQHLILHACCSGDECSRLRCHYGRRLTDERISHPIPSYIVFFQPIHPLQSSYSYPFTKLLSSRLLLSRPPPI